MLRLSTPQLLGSTQCKSTQKLQVWGTLQGAILACVGWPSSFTHGCFSYNKKYPSSCGVNDLSESNVGIWETLHKPATQHSSKMHHGPFWAASITASSPQYLRDSKSCIKQHDKHVTSRSFSLFLLVRRGEGKCSKLLSRGLGAPCLGCCVWQRKQGEQRASDADKKKVKVFCDGF